MASIQWLLLSGFYLRQLSCHHRQHGDEPPDREHDGTAGNADAAAKKGAGVDDTRTLPRLRGRKSRQRQPGYYLEVRYFSAALARGLNKSRTASPRFTASARAACPSS